MKTEKHLNYVIKNNDTGEFYTGNNHNYWGVIETAHKYAREDLAKVTKDYIESEFCLNVEVKTVEIKEV